MGDDTSAIDKINSRFSGALIEVEDFRDETTLNIKKQRSFDLLKFLKEDPDLQYDYLVDLSCVDYLAMDRHPRFSVVYHLYSYKTGQRLIVKVPVEESDPTLDSVLPIWMGAIWTEREVYDMFGIKFNGHPDLRRILMPSDFEGYPLRKDYPLRGRGERDRIANPDPGFEEISMSTVEKIAGESENEGDRLSGERMVLNFGPQHPATHGTLRLVLELDGERVVNVIPDIGYLHTGFEKLGENLDYNQFITLTDRMNYMSPLSNNIGYAIAVEKLLGIEVPKRAQYIRVILYELSRISDHVVWLGTAALDLGAFTAFLWAFKEREKLYDIFDAVTGTRLTTSYTRVGGLFEDVPENFKDMVEDFTRHFPKRLKDIDDLLTKNRIWIDRTKGIGVISAEDAISYSLTGPILRGSGVEWDIRKAEPYSSYEEFEFEIPTGDNGDAYDRYLVRMEEMIQSNNIVKQAMENLPDGPVKVPDAKVILPEKDEVYNRMESLIHHFKLIMTGHGIEPPKAEIYSSTESPNGELGFYIVSDGSGFPYRVRVRPPSFINYQAFPHMIKGHMYSDIVAVLGSLNIIAGELDR